MARKIILLFTSVEPIYSLCLFLPFPPLFIPVFLVQSLSFILDLKQSRSINPSIVVSDDESEKD